MRSQVTLRLNPDKERDHEIILLIEDRDRNKYPTIHDYMIAAVQALEERDNQEKTRHLTRDDLQSIHNVVYRTLEYYEEQKIKSMMAP